MKVTTNTTQDHVAAHNAAELKAYLTTQIENGRSTLTASNVRTARKGQLVEWAWECVQREKEQLQQQEQDKADAYAAQAKSDWGYRPVESVFAGLVDAFQKLIDGHKEMAEKFVAKAVQGDDPLQQAQSMLYEMEWRYTAQKANLLSYRETNALFGFLQTNLLTQDRPVAELVEALEEMRESETRRLIDFSVSSSGGVRAAEQEAELATRQYAAKMTTSLCRALAKLLEKAYAGETTCEQLQFEASMFRVW